MPQVTRAAAPEYNPFDSSAQAPGNIAFSSKPAPPPRPTAAPGQSFSLYVSLKLQWPTSQGGPSLDQSRPPPRSRPSTRLLLLWWLQVQMILAVSKCVSACRGLVTVQEYEEREAAAARQRAALSQVTVIEGRPANFPPFSMYVLLLLH
jgi:hypothetical protein